MKIGWYWLLQTGVDDDEKLTVTSAIPRDENDNMNAREDDVDANGNDDEEGTIIV